MPAQKGKSPQHDDAVRQEYDNGCLNSVADRLEDLTSSIRKAPRTRRSFAQRENRQQRPLSRCSATLCATRCTSSDHTAYIYIHTHTHTHPPKHSSRAAATFFGFLENIRGESQADGRVARDRLPVIARRATAASSHRWRVFISIAPCEFLGVDGSSPCSRERVPGSQTRTDTVYSRGSSAAVRSRERNWAELPGTTSASLLMLFSFVAHCHRFDESSSSPSSPSSSSPPSSFLSTSPSLSLHTRERDAGYTRRYHSTHVVGMRRATGRHAVHWGAVRLFTLAGP